MAHFYFHLHDDLDVPDCEGAEFPDLTAARAYAIAAACRLMCETLVHDGRITLSHWIDIEDEQGEVAASVSFADAVCIER